LVFGFFLEHVFLIFHNSADILAYKYIYCAAATPPTQFGSEKSRGRSYLR